MIDSVCMFLMNAVEVCKTVWYTSNIFVNNGDDDGVEYLFSL